MLVLERIITPLKFSYRDDTEDTDWLSFDINTDNIIIILIKIVVGIILLVIVSIGYFIVSPVSIFI
jgi:hypothetical protein